MRGMLLWRHRVGVSARTTSASDICIRMLSGRWLRSVCCCYREVCNSFVLCICSRCVIRDMSHCHGLTNAVAKLRLRSGPRPIKRRTTSTPEQHTYNVNRLRFMPYLMRISASSDVLRTTPTPAPPHAIPNVNFSIVRHPQGSQRRCMLHKTVSCSPSIYRQLHDCRHFYEVDIMS